MKRLCLCALLVVAFQVMPRAQHLQITDTKFYCNGHEETFGEVNDIIQTKDGGFAFVGNTLDSGGGIIPKCNSTFRHSIMGRLDSVGNVVWIKNMCSVGTNAKTICETPDGGFATDAGPVPAGTSGYPGFLIYRYDKRGILMWSKQYGKNASAGVSQIISTSDKGFLMLGGAMGIDSDIKVNYQWPPILFQPIDWVVIKLDSMGNKQWVHTLGTSGDESYARIYAIGNSYYLTGLTTSKDHDCADTLHHPDGAIYTIKLDTAGRVVWSKARGSGIVTRVMYDDRDNTIMVTGYSNAASHLEFPQGVGGDDFFLMKLDTAGEFKWAKKYGTQDEELDTRICKAPQRGYFLCGYSYNGQTYGTLTSIDSAGKQLELRRISADNGGVAFLAIHPSGSSYAIFGSTECTKLEEGTGTNCTPVGSAYCGSLSLSKAAVWKVAAPNINKPENDFFVAPNPAHSKCTIRFSGAHGAGQIVVTAGNGQTVFRQSVAVQQSSLAISTNNWSAGSYILCWQPVDGKARYQTVVIQ